MSTAPALAAIATRVRDYQAAMLESFPASGLGYVNGCNLAEVCSRMARTGWARGERTTRRYLGMLCDAGKLERDGDGRYRRVREKAA